MMTKVNYIKHLNAVYTVMAEDARLSPHHISLYLAIFQLWNLNHFKSPISIARSEMKTLAKIGSNNTYSKCLRQLHEFAYIKYTPSYNPMVGSKVTCIRFDGAEEETKHTTAVQQPKQEKGASLKHVVNKSKTTKQKVKVPPDFKCVEAFFKNQSTSYPAINLSTEAQRFFNHFASNGWKVGGKSPMIDWKAAARNWLLNAVKFTNNQSDLQPKQLDINTNKNYNEPL